MKDLKFDSKAFTEAIMKAVQPDLDVIKDIKEKKNAISIKAMATEQEIKTLRHNGKQLSKTDDFIDDTIEAHEKRLNKLDKIETRKRTLASFESGLTNAGAKCDADIQLVRERLCEALRTSVNSYVIKARLPIVEVIAEILNADKICRDSVINLYMQLIQNSGIRQHVPTFGLDNLTKNLYPLFSQIPALETMVNDVKKGVE